MFKTAVYGLLLLVAVQSSLQDVVSTSAACARIGKYYDQGCSGLTAELLGKSWKAVS